MILSHQHIFSLKLSILLVYVLLIFNANAKSQSRSQNHVKDSQQNHSVSAILVFGDSTSDPGNNNFILTPFKGNFPPYGRDFPNRIPTGRFTNGLLASDLIARYLGVKDNVPPYLDPSLTVHDLSTGVSFASAGSGYDPLTPKISNVIPLPRQLEYFREYKTRLAAKFGQKRTMEIVNNALYIVSAGTNDFVVNYFTLPIQRHKYSLPSYMDFVMNKQLDFLEGLLDEGARKMLVAGLPPMGCLPIVITLFSENAFFDRGCIDFFSSVGRSYNSMLQTQLNTMQVNHAKQGSKVVYLDTYSTLYDAIANRKYGFKEVKRGCCGTGLLETTFLCNHKSSTCTDASKYAFWDSIHPTEQMYRIFFDSTKPVVDNIIKG
ncbi:GDSL-like Lipase/Acylhydrolase superfamily protein [Artemisia annua]|uniref:GDSL-like Lipase/Acylhydrolase superfamily protein n=1 Tax=Artemisia annua TaxID=35608 RepID=A0A2U1LI60_ARTAN|nr:GDSL-like Lipase/Acylhydrolase superfamily protein [Artemisia annua]